METLLTSIIAAPDGAVNAIAAAQIPEPSNMALFALGAAGLIIGRTIAKKKRHSDD